MKLPLYGRHGIAGMWIADLQQRVLEAYSDPTPDGYGEPAKYPLWATLAPRLVPEIQVTLRHVFD